jgi:hypothetical protein
MVFEIEIEYWWSWGYTSPANKLKQSIQSAFPDYNIICRSAIKVTGKIEVSWINGILKNVIWTSGKNNTENNHKTIIKFLK